MSATTQRITNLVSLSVSHVALNPVLTASLIWILTRGPPAVRERIFARFASLRDIVKLNRIIKSLKWLLALGLLKNVNKYLNSVALNANRLRSEKKRWAWDQEIAVVTGGCGGIGELTVKGLVKKGVRVAILDIQQLPASLQGYANIKFFACDITNPNAVSSTAERIREVLGSPTILVNNAGVATAHTILETSDEWLKKVFEVNLLSNWYTTKAFLPDMLKINKGHIVTVASAASFIGVAGMADYCSTKAGVLSFHEALNQELRHRYKAPGILTTSVHPYWVNTPLIKTWEAALRAQGAPLIEPHVIADAIVSSIMGASGGQVFLPQTVSTVSLLRGLPNWLQERLRDGTSKSVLQGVLEA